MILVTPRVFPDGRGFFLESWKRSEFARAGIDQDFLQDNHSQSSAGVLRGLHYQRDPDAQGKLIRVIAGSAWDVGVDIRPGSSTFSQWFGTELSAENRKMLYIPPGFAHGFITLRDDTHFLYKCTREYAPESDAGIRWDDPDLAIDWPKAGDGKPLVSEKDAKLPFLKDAML